MQSRGATHRSSFGWTALAALIVVATGCGSDGPTSIPACNFVQITAPTGNITVDQTLQLTGTVFTPDISGTCVGTTDLPLDWTVDTTRVTLETTATNTSTITVRGKALGTAHITVSTSDSTVSGFADIVVSRFGAPSRTH
jgi:predicted small lipoprotein YifL